MRLQTRLSLLSAVALLAAVLPAVADAAPSSTSSPAITGVAKLGETLAVSDGTWDPAPASRSYAWARCSSWSSDTGWSCTLIAGATAPTYDVQDADHGQRVRASVTASDPSGSTTAVSDVSGPITGDKPANLEPPTLAGEPLAGSRFVASPGRWKAASRIEYRWSYCMPNDTCPRPGGVTGGNERTPTVSPGERIAVTVVASNAVGSTEVSVISSMIRPHPRIFGGAVIGARLRTASYAAAGATNNRIWQRCTPGCSDIPGANAETYRVTEADAGAALRLVQTVSGGGQSATGTSDPTAGVLPPATSGGIGLLNAARRAHGIPASVAENPEWSRGCREHMHYLNLNPGITDAPSYHNQAPGRPGSTPDGAWAGSHAVLAPGSRGDSEWRGPWTPWSPTAPFHEAQVMDPTLAISGYSTGCLVTLSPARRDDFAPGDFFSVPGPGVTAVPTTQPTDMELPRTPAQQLGLKAEHVGYNIIVYAPGLRDPQTMWSATLTKATLSHGGISDEVRTVDRAGFGSASGILVPPKPLEPNTRYDVSATWRGPTGTEAVQRFSFETGAATPLNPSARPRDNRILLSAWVVRPRGGPQLRVRATSIAPNVDVRLRRGARKLPLRPKRVRDEVQFTRRLPRPGTYRLCASSGGGSTGTPRVQQCSSLRLSKGGDLRMRKLRPWCESARRPHRCGGALDRRFPLPPR